MWRRWMAQVRTELGVESVAGARSLVGAERGGAVVAAFVHALLVHGGQARRHEASQRALLLQAAAARQRAPDARLHRRRRRRRGRGHGGRARARRARRVARVVTVVLAVIVIV